MTTPSKPKDPAYKRLILFPVALFYIAVLGVSSWPEQLAPGGRVMAATQMAANHLLAQAAILPSVNIFTGDTEGDRTATVRTCFRILGYTSARPGGGNEARGARPAVLFDSMPRCDRNEREAIKDPYRWFHDQHLRRGIDHLYTPGAELDRNQPPLNILFSILDYHCHRTGPLSHLVLISRHERLDLDTGEVIERTTAEGSHRCASGRWDVIRAPYRGGNDDR